MLEFRCKPSDICLFVLRCTGVAILLAGCSSFTATNSETLATNDDDKVAAAMKQLLANTKPEIESNKSIQFHGLRHGVSLSDYTDTIAMKFYEQFIPSSGVTVASFVDFNASLNSTHPFGNQLSEALKTSLTRVGYPIVEVNLENQINITDKGNFVLTRENKTQPLEFVVVGTLVYREHGINIDARLIEAKSQKTYAATSLTIPSFMIQ